MQSRLFYVRKYISTFGTHFNQSVTTAKESQKIQATSQEKSQGNEDTSQDAFQFVLELEVVSSSFCLAGFSVKEALERQGEREEMSGVVGRLQHPVLTVFFFLDNFKLTDLVICKTGASL